MTPPIPWPEGATCGRCRWWGGPSTGDAECTRVVANTMRPATKDVPMTITDPAAFYTHRDHGCRAWKPRAPEKAE